MGYVVKLGGGTGRPPAEKPKEKATGAAARSRSAAAGLAVGERQKQMIIIGAVAAVVVLCAGIVIYILIPRQSTEVAPLDPGTVQTQGGTSTPAAAPMPATSAPAAAPMPATGAR